MDRRERILNRLDELLRTIPGMAAYVRNRGELPPEKRPALVLLDADETVLLQRNDARGQLVTAPMLLVMRPEIFVVLEDREPNNEGVGQELNRLRREILPVLLPTVSSDETLKQLVGSNGFIRYEGLLTDMATGRSMTGTMQFQFAFAYPFKLSELTEGV